MSNKVNLETQGKVELKKEIGLVAATAIVVGNMIGSGVFMAPQSLALVSNPKSTMLAWIITSIGSIFVALVFARLSEKYPHNGGPIVFTGKAYGEFPAFLIAWTYWIGAWVGNAAIITAFMSYFSYFFPVFANSRILAFLMSSAVLWVLTLLNIKGSKEVGIFGVITTVCKILPLLIFAAIALTHFNPTNFTTIADPKLAGMGTTSAAVAITLWSFIGLESASVAAGDIKDPQKNVKKATTFGIIITAVIYILICLAAIGASDQSTLANSPAPLALIINNITGSSWGGTLIAVGALISTLGAASGWILLTARAALAAGEDKIFPKEFAVINPKTHTPINALIISAIAANILLIMNYVGSLQAAYNFMILLATLAFIPAYCFCSMGEILLLKKRPKDFNLGVFIKGSILSLIAFFYSVYVMYGGGGDAVMWCFILMLLGTPFYVYVKMQHRTPDKMEDVA